MNTYERLTHLNEIFLVYQLDEEKWKAQCENHSYVI